MYKRTRAVKWFQKNNLDDLRENWKIKKKSQKTLKKAQLQNKD